MHDALNRHFVFEHDKLGRLTRRVQGIDVSTMEYDTAAHGIGFLARTLGADGHAVEYEYDSLSRPAKTTLRLADGRDFSQSQSYDPFGRPLRSTYPNGMSVVREYDNVGTLIHVRNGVTRAPIWSLQMVDVVGQTMLERFGNNATTERIYDDETTQLQTIFTMANSTTLQSLRLEYDGQQNVVNRFDARQGKREHFKHDALNRITCARIDSCQPSQICGDLNVPCDVNVTYSSTGSITLKSDVGVYVPDPLHPHAVLSAGNAVFVHDAVGNQIERPGETITYTDFDLPRQYIPKNGGVSTDFEYSAAGERVRRIRGEQEVVYLGDVYEHETNGNTVIERICVSNNERVVAISERINGAETWQFVHTDHLGSVDAISDAAGTEVERRSFDAWGAPRNPKWGNPAPVANGTDTRRGFTWHESDDEVGLVNAKGRLYDPKISRFLQVDPIISEPLDAQTHNPYSYVRNRPLVFTDPSGFVDEAESVLIYGGGTPTHVTPEEAHLAADTQKTWIFRAPRDAPASAPPPPSTAEVAPSAPDSAQPSGMTPGEQFVFGVGERAWELGPELVTGLVMNNVTIAGNGGRGSIGALGACSASPNGCGDTRPWDGGRVLDEVNGINPLYVAAIDVVKADEGYDKGDYVQIGRSTMGLFTTVVITAVTLKVGARSKTSQTSALETRAHQIHDVLHPIAQKQRTTAVMVTNGKTIVASGARDLSPLQRSLLNSNESPAHMPGAHAEVSAIQHATMSGLKPKAIAATRPFCQQCAVAIEASGGKITSPTTAVWRK